MNSPSSQPSDLILAPKTWKLSYSADGSPVEGFGSEDRCGSKGWFGQTVLDISPYERLQTVRYAAKVNRRWGHRATMISRTRYDPEFNQRHRFDYDNSEIGCWFENEDDHKGFLALMMTWPPRDIEFMIDREMTSEERRLIKKLNHHIVECTYRETDRVAWLVSTEYHRNVVELRLKTA